MKSAARGQRAFEDTEDDHEAINDKDAGKEIRDQHDYEKSLNTETEVDILDEVNSNEESTDSLDEVEYRQLSLHNGQDTFVHSATEEYFVLILKINMHLN